MGCIPIVVEVFIVTKHGNDWYYFLKVVRRGFDVYCIPPHLGVHYSVHESGEAHFRSEAKEAKPGKEPPVVVQDGEAATPFGKGIIRRPLKDLGRASGICTAFYPIDSLSKDFQKFDRSAEGCFVIDVDDTDSFCKDSSLVEIGVWAVPERNGVSFEFNIRDIPAKLLYKVTRCEPQIWIYAWPL